MSRFKLRNRTSLLASLSLANYSEFGLIVAYIGVSSGWIGSEWLIIIAIALSAIVYHCGTIKYCSVPVIQSLAKSLSGFESSQRIGEEEAIEPGHSAEVMIFGMGRVGGGAYDSLRERMGDKVLGVDFQRDMVDRLRA